MHKSLSVIIPCYNETARILPTLHHITKQLSQQKYDFEIIVVDDASTDASVSVIEQADFPHCHVINNVRNQGKGQSIRTGISQATKEWVMYTDADGMIPFTELKKFEPHLKKYDLLVGSRKMPGAEVTNKTGYRSLLSSGFAFFVKALVVRGFYDTQCPFKLFRKPVAQRLFSKGKVKHFAFDVELLFLAKKYKLKTKELPVQGQHKTNTTMRVFKDSLIMLFDLLRIRWNDFCKRYDGV
jgi:dolichyl-phosphate beta-glucosyltransferase